VCVCAHMRVPTHVPFSHSGASLLCAIHPRTLAVCARTDWQLRRQRKRAVELSALRPYVAGQAPRLAKVDVASGYLTVGGDNTCLDAFSNQGPDVFVGSSKVHACVRFPSCVCASLNRFISSSSVLGTCVCASARENDATVCPPRIPPFRPRALRGPRTRLLHLRIRCTHARRQVLAGGSCQDHDGWWRS
jgi:hypothetical protein